jgi:pyruvate formate lyase activating enzyme
LRKNHYPIFYQIQNDCKSISYTYNEPTIFYEYSYDTAKIAHKKEIKNIIVSNGFVNEEPLRQWGNI